MSETQAVATVKVDNARVRVTEWRFAPGARTGHHRHEYAYVVVPLVSGSLAATGAGRETTSALQMGEPYYREAGVEHDVRNANAFEFAFIEIELKGARETC
ncbi:MAG TPA: cupin domain-containing protein [Candidatus Deferrimicrobiaceae bacterium]|nr:cupin domain-containing protein [Candidatus Deferrimicrobiaceae bacterium]